MNTRMLIGTVVVSMFVLCQQVHAQDDEPEQSETTELEGTWERVSLVVGGRQIDVPDGAQWRFEGNREYYRKADDEDWNSGNTFSVDPSAMPKEIELLWVKARDESLSDIVDSLSDIFDTFMMPGIYELDGDSLTIGMGSPRPDVIDSSKILYTFRRVEEDDE